MKRIYTIGHSNHNSEDFINLLKKNQIDDVYDIRSEPYSKYVKWACYGNIGGILKDAGIDYIFMGKELGGKNCDYQEKMNSATFQNGINDILQRSGNRVIALMCAEENPNNCHRQHLLAKYLLTSFPDEVEIYHIRGNGEAQRASLEGEIQYLNL